MTEDPQNLFRLIELADVKKALELIKQNNELRYIRKSDSNDQTPLHCALSLM